MSPARSGPFRRAARGVLRWTLTYTRGLAPEVAAARQDEIASDLHEHAVWAEQAGMGAGALARDLRRRALLGAPADLVWRRRQVRASDPAHRFALRANAGLLVAVLTIGLVEVALGVFTMARVFRAVAIGDLGWVPRDTLLVAGLTLAAFVALVGFSRRRWRSAAAAALAVPTALLALHAGRILWYASATMVVVVGSAPWWDAATSIASAGLAILCLAAAFHWWREDVAVRAAHAVNPRRSR
ncbi:hypothetical protein FLP10_11970 [Agromyces intestinalis]|uniref:Uncharacterized protein n=1 Tax=Agromyces intestinalis TaxID=2592652 RepID=A0A5C1YGE4_9MICO|nr:hypothetical protein [Agromyces intestinalis]QEO15051.1 hypothetical protein FLP10_11970 [Agromyces intestinalis]